MPWSVAQIFTVVTSSRAVASAFHGVRPSPYKCPEQLPKKARAQPLRAPQVRDVKVRHPFVACGICGEVHFAGLKFQCLNCPCYDVCERCEPQLLEQHDASHVYTIVSKPDFQWRGAHMLPEETPVVVMGRKKRSQQEGKEGTISDWQAKTGRYGVKLAFEPRTVHVQAEDVQPLFADVDALVRVLRSEGRGRSEVGGRPERHSRRSCSRGRSRSVRRGGGRNVLRLRSRSRHRPQPDIEELEQQLNALLATLRR